MLFSSGLLSIVPVIQEAVIPVYIPHLDGSTLSLIWIIPFCTLLLSIALFPLFAPNFWHHHYGKVGAVCIMITLIPLAYFTNISLIKAEIIHTFFYHYFPFICLLLALFTLGGGIQIVLRGHSTPTVNLLFLLAGALLTNLIGTTGAAMLLIRPYLAVNHYRQHKTHLAIFFIFLVANVGGCLTPLGDPPLFLGFLNDVDFFWPLKNLAAPYALVLTLILIVFYAVDSFYFSRDKKIKTPQEIQRYASKFMIKGKRNILLLPLVSTFILLNGTSEFRDTVFIGSVPVEIKGLIRDFSLIILAFISYKITPKAVYEFNQFSWVPLKEVAKIFAAIFITILPVNAILAAGKNGSLSQLIDLANPNYIPNNMLYFWLSGFLSGFLDNAPTYLIFFQMAGSDPIMLMGPLYKTLMAISMGSVFMGAYTYIGNAPNFMVKSIAHDCHIKMPSFLGYIGWSSVILLPIFFIMSLIYF